MQCTILETQRAETSCSVFIRNLQYFHLCPDNNNNSNKTLQQQYQHYQRKDIVRSTKKCGNLNLDRDLLFIICTSPNTVHIQFAFSKHSQTVFCVHDTPHSNIYSNRKMRNWIQIWVQFFFFACDTYCGWFLRVPEDSTVIKSKWQCEIVCYIYAWFKNLNVHISFGQTPVLR